ncbi:TPA: CXXX repeat peptide modification system protein [Clostridium botulinum]|uniref:CXXX repeat peptide modification system protein n=1 Tax=Clostridium botulinum TaxID=1491 RepID=UPI0001F84B6A|nr:CXXX repeat peptide modification system protein [Clostridium botulinum]MBY6846452.1 CXXX repeat peptide modification system protein [Clostridium botulinum]MBY6952815.1 CXXX repeat peptide modification system protein [Clostridium botulinum]MCR1139374.1 CXXX repeat peptide modification system protein [Clostridium botulinum]MCR1166244.1 CXXX repeat peptide modification system protein [Clostridium botulinum]NEZ77498.1 CXXX repeat peptide modification system protein [Clostridium botulinum]
MNRKILATVTEEERDVVEELYERMYSLKSFIRLLSEKKLEPNEQNFLYKKILNDWYDTKKRYDYWWQNTVQKYNLSKNDIEKLYMDFGKMQIYPID